MANHKKTANKTKQLQAEQVQLMKDMLEDLGIDFVKKNNSFTIGYGSVELMLYFDAIGNKYVVLSVKTGREAFSTNRIGSLKSKIAQVFKITSTVSNKPIKTKTKSSRPDGKSKTEVARDIFNSMYGKKKVERKDVIQKFIDEAGLTKAGASTYYQNFKRESN